MKTNTFILLFFLGSFSYAQSDCTALSITGLNKTYSTKDRVSFRINNNSNDSLFAFIGLEVYREGAWSIVTDDIFRTEIKKVSVMIIIAPNSYKEISQKGFYREVFEKDKQGLEYIKVKKPGRYRFRIEWNKTPGRDHIFYSEEFSYK